jgi:Skp family chaperone for outer membrane proteins
MKNIIFVVGLALALASPLQAQEKSPPVSVDPKKIQIERPDAAKAKQAEKDANKKVPPKKTDKNAPPVKKAEAVKCDIKKDPKCQNVVRKPKTKEEREAEKAAKEAAKK